MAVLQLVARMDSIKNWSEEQVRLWLTDNRFGEYAQRFFDEMINGDMFLDMSDHKLQLLGVARPFHRERLLKDIAKLNAAEAASASAAVPAPSASNAASLRTSVLSPALSLGVPSVQTSAMSISAPARPSIPKPRNLLGFLSPHPAGRFSAPSSGSSLSPFAIADKTPAPARSLSDKTLAPSVTLAPAGSLSGKALAPPHGSAVVDLTNDDHKKALLEMAYEDGTVTVSA